jgi:hypothetical protein
VWTQLVERLVLKFCLAQLEEMTNGNSATKRCCSGSKSITEMMAGYCINSENGENESFLNFNRK